MSYDLIILLSYHNSCWPETIRGCLQSPFLRRGCLGRGCRPLAAEIRSTQTRLHKDLDDSALFCGVNSNHITMILSNMKSKLHDFCSIY